jgi:predicted alpha/beta hydrolase family esterase
MNTKILIIPGLGDSGENHWQTLWHKKFANSERIIQDEWNEPQLENWLKRLYETIVKQDSPIIMVAHSLAVSLILHWSEKYDTSIVKGALLVAPADVESPSHTPEIIRNFAPIPTRKLPFPSIVVASDNDPFVDFKRAKYFAAQWGSEFVNIGSKGHINAESGLGVWAEGQLLLQNLIKKSHYQSLKQVS